MNIHDIDMYEESHPRGILSTPNRTLDDFGMPEISIDLDGNIINASKGEDREKFYYWFECNSGTGFTLNKKKGYSTFDVDYYKFRYRVWNHLSIVLHIVTIIVGCCLFYHYCRFGL